MLHTVLDALYLNYPDSEQIYKGETSFTFYELGSEDSEYKVIVQGHTASKYQNCELNTSLFCPKTYISVCAMCNLCIIYLIFSMCHVLSHKQLHLILTTTLQDGIIIPALFLRNLRLTQVHRDFSGNRVHTYPYFPPPCVT